METRIEQGGKVHSEQRFGPRIKKVKMSVDVCVTP
jgi:hypothetical protein